LAHKSKEQLKAIHAKDNPSTSDIDRFKLLAKTSGKMGIKKEEFAMFAGKVVTPSEKIKLEEQKALKEKGKKK